MTINVRRKAHHDGLKMARPEWNALLLLLVVSALCAIQSGKTDGCPTVCTCRWKSGKEMVICTNQGLSSVPTNVDGSTQVLDLSHNPLHTLPAEMFVRVKLLNLQRIYLSHCRLTWLHRSAFTRLTNLVELDLSHNLLKQVPSETFAEFPDLRRLNLASNPIEKIDKDAFAHLASLTNLELSECQIEWIDDQAFRGLFKLTQLKLDANHLTRVDGATLVHFSSLHAIELHRNPWQCDCHLLNLFSWLTKRKIHSSSPVRCDQPRHLKGHVLEQLTADKLACKPKGSYVSKQARVTEGDDALLSCRITGNPEPKVQWVWRDRVINNHTFTFATPQTFIIHESGTTNKTSALRIVGATRQNAGRYSCVGENNAGQFTATTNLHVVAKDDEHSDVYAGHVLGIFVATTLITTVCITICFLVVKQRYLKDKYSKVLVTYEEAKPLNSSYCKDKGHEEINKSSIKTYTGKCAESADGMTFVVNDIRVPRTPQFAGRLDSGSLASNNRNEDVKPQKQMLKDKIANAIRTPTPDRDSSINSFNEEMSKKNADSQSDIEVSENKVQFDHVTVESKWKKRNTSAVSKYDTASSNEWLPTEINCTAFQSPKFNTQDKLWPLCEFPAHNSNICVYNSSEKNCHLDLECISNNSEATPKETNSTLATFLCDIRETDL